MTEGSERSITIPRAGALAAGLLLLLVQASACSSAKSPPAESPRAETSPPREAQQTPAAPPAAEQPQPEPAEPTQPKSVEPTLPKSAEPAPPKPPEPTQPKAAEPSQPKTAAPAPAKPAPPPAPKPAEPPRPKESAAAPAPAPQHAAIVNLTALEKRLRDTSAIGLFTKLSLKNEVDDLLERFRTFHAGRGGATLPRLREGYDLLVLKVVALLQDKDAALARDISTSREALWTLLADPAKFKTL